LLLVESDHLDVGTPARQFDRVHSGAGTEIDNARFGRRRQHRENLVGRQVLEARRVVEQCRTRRIESLGLTGAVAIIMAMRAMAVTAAIVLAVLAIVHRKTSVRVWNNLPNALLMNDRATLAETATLESAER
jgi:hypothetical protein